MKKMTSTQQMANQMSSGEIAPEEAASNRRGATVMLADAPQMLRHDGSGSASNGSLLGADTSGVRRRRRRGHVRAQGHGAEQALPETNALPFEETIEASAVDADYDELDAEGVHASRALVPYNAVSGRASQREATSRNVRRASAPVLAAQFLDEEEISEENTLERLLDVLDEMRDETLDGEVPEALEAAEAPEGTSAGGFVGEEEARPAQYEAVMRLAAPRSLMQDGYRLGEGRAHLPWQFPDARPRAARGCEAGDDGQAEPAASAHKGGEDGDPQQHGGGAGKAERVGADKARWPLAQPHPEDGQEMDGRC